jgi:hypothetical protein
MNDEELQVLIPSEYVREYVRKTNWTFTDAQKASLLVNGELTLKEMYPRLRELKEHTEDEELRGQLAMYLDHKEKNLAAFRDNSSRNSIYLVKIRDEDEQDKPYAHIHPGGYFFNLEMAYAYGKKEKQPFLIEKHLVGDVKTDREDGEEYQDIGLGDMTFDKDGEADYFEGWEVPYENKPHTLEFFEDAFYEVPYPFERGDIVRLVGTEDYGIVDVSQEDWKKWVLRCQEYKRQQKGSGPDFTDAYVRVEFLNDDGTFSHGHINPILLELHQLDEKCFNDYGPRDQLLLEASAIQRGKGGLDDLYFGGMVYARWVETGEGLQ